MSNSNIKAIRKYKHMTQRDLADALKVDTSVISKYESGKISPSYTRLMQIADALGVQVDMLLCDSGTVLSYDRRRMPMTSTDEDRYVVADNPLPADELLEKAEGVCDLCGSKMPLIRSGSTWFLETHYIKWLSRGGQNTKDNIAVLCPNCHKLVHMISYEESLNLLKNTEK